MEMKKKTKTKIRNVQWVNEQGINGGETAKKEGGGGERESMGAGGMWTKKFCMGVRRGNFYLSLVKNTLT